MIAEIKKLRFIISRSGCRLNPFLIPGILVGTLLESLSIGLIMPLIVLLSKGNQIYTHHLMMIFIELTGFRSYWIFLISALIAVLLVYLVKTLFLTVITKQQNKFIFSLEARISEKLLETYLEQPYIYHIQRNSSQIIKNIYHEVKQLGNTIGQVLTLFSEGIVLFLLTLILFYFQPLATISAIAFLGSIFVIFLRGLRKKVKRWGNERKNLDVERVKTLSNIFSNIKEIKLYGHYGKSLNDFSDLNRPSIGASMKHATYLKLPSIWLEFLAVLCLTLLIGAMIIHGNTLLSIVPLLSLFVASLFRILPSLNRISSAYQTIRFHLPVVSSIYNELHVIPAKSQEKDPIPYVFSHQIELQNISYNYPDAIKDAVNNVSLIIPRGEYIGIMGQSGSGKSTLIDLTIGLLEPREGILLVDGKNIYTDLKSWQKQIGYVSQNINLMDDTIRRNIAFSIQDNEIDPVLLNIAIEKAQLKEFIESLPEGLESIAGEKGIRMSGGQRQRIGIARALYHDPSILVLDEATSSLDTITELAIIKTIDQLKGRKTIIIVTHKRFLLEKCDKVYEMKRGKINEFNLT